MLIKLRSRNGTAVGPSVEAVLSTIPRDGFVCPARPTTGPSRANGIDDAARCREVLASTNVYSLLSTADCGGALPAGEYKHN